MSSIPYFIKTFKDLIIYSKEIVMVEIVRVPNENIS